NAPDFFRLLRIGAKRPRGHGTTKDSDKFPSPHGRPSSCALVVRDRPSYRVKPVPGKRRLLSALGQKRTCAAQQLISSNGQKRTWAYSIPSSAALKSPCGNSRPSNFAVLRLITSSYLVGACTDRCARVAPV